MMRPKKCHYERDAGTRRFAPSSAATPSTLVAVKVEVEDIPVRPLGFKKRCGMAYGKKAVSSSSAVGPSSSPAVRSVAVKLAEARRKAMEKEKEPAVMQEVDISSDSLCIYMSVFVFKFV